MAARRLVRRVGPMGNTRSLDWLAGLGALNEAAGEAAEK